MKLPDLARIGRRLVPTRQASDDQAFLGWGRSSALAHRGDRAGHPPGNHLAAFQSAIDAGIDHIESDVHRTADDRLVLFHDDRLDAETTGSGALADHTWAELSTVRYRHRGEPTDHGLVLLEDALGLWPDIRWNLDAKDGAAVEPLVELVADTGSDHRVLLTAFDVGTLRRLRRLAAPPTCTGLARIEIAAIRAASLLGLSVPPIGDAAQVPESHRGVTVVDRRFVDTCHEAGIAVHVWTINDRQTMDRLLDLGVDGIISDDPRLLRATLDGRT